ncbi:MAG: hypothetical protein DI589_20780 [Shinella sp.]|nr:MAG: hypothetical protein DI589_20780 [Shinella sp.]
MTELKYVPDLDTWDVEVSTDPQLSPNDFIERDGEGWKLRPADKDDAEDIESFPHFPVKNGDIVLFDEYRNFGTHRLAVDHDGNWTITPEPPNYANCFALPYDFESMAHSIPDLIEYNSSEITRGTEIDIEIWWWSDTGKPWQFVVDGETAQLIKFVGQA